MPQLVKEVKEATVFFGPFWYVMEGHCMVLYGLVLYGAEYGMASGTCCKG